MKKTLKEYRLQRHLSQNELAERSGVSLRTIQRVESGTSAGSPYVVRQLCTTLGIDWREVNNAEDPSGSHAEAETEDGLPAVSAVHRYDKLVKYVNFSALSVLCFPLLNLLVPSVLYLVYKSELPDSRDRSAVLKILDLQILWTAITLVALIAVPLADHLFLGLGHVLEIPLFLWAYLLMVIGLVAIILKTANDINKTEKLLVFLPDIL